MNEFINSSIETKITNNNDEHLLPAALKLKALRLAMQAGNQEAINALNNDQLIIVSKLEEEDFENNKITLINFCKRFGIEYN